MLSWPRRPAKAGGACNDARWLHRIKPVSAAALLALAAGAALLTEPLFSLLHGFSLPGTVALTLGGMVLAFAYETTGTLWAPIALHAASNGLCIAYTLALGR